MDEFSAMAGSSFQQNDYNLDDTPKGFSVLESPITVTAIIVTYLTVVLKLGPWFMKDRRPFQLVGVMRVYNALQILTNFMFLTYELIIERDITLVAVKSMCSVTSDVGDLARYKYLIVLGHHLYTSIKIFDLFDTLFMVLRKKDSHISFLHVYHHVAMVFFSWLTTRFTKTTFVVFPASINVFVHMIMYSYYFLATFGPSVQKYLWWKRHLTKLQLIQFAIILCYLVMLYFYNCPVPALFVYSWMGNVLIIMCLFLNFYIKAYLSKPKPNATTDIQKKVS